MPNTDTIFAGSVDEDTMGSRIIRARDSAGMSQGDLAKHLGVKKATVEKWESDRSEPRAHLAMRMAGMLGVTPTWLFGGVGDAPEAENISPEVRAIRQQLENIKQMRDRTTHAITAIEQALEATSAVLSDLSGAAGMVMVPTREQRLAQFSLVNLGQGRALAVLVGEDGAVENRLVELGGAIAPTALEQASNYITARLAGRTLAEAASAMRAEIANGRSQLDRASADLVERGLAVWSEDAAQRPVLIVRGQANLLDDTALSDIERVRSLLDDLENKQSVAELLESAREADATRIFIGSENRLFALSGSSVIASPYRDREGRVVGVLGVIGPTRLNYARVVPMVDLTARSLGKLIG